MNRIFPNKIHSMSRSLKGSYILEFHLTGCSSIKIGKLGEFELQKGWYYYIGSALNGLRGRLSRHMLGIGKLYWHIDYLTRRHKPARIWYLTSESKIEQELSRIVSLRTSPAIHRFGCGDSKDSRTHLYYSRRRRNFLKDIKRLGKTYQVDL